MRRTPAILSGSLRTLAMVAAILAGVVAPSHAADQTLGDRLDDAILHTAVRLALLEELKLDALDLEIDADAGTGHVTVSGEVADRAARELTEEIVLAVDGVTEVDADLELEPDARPDAGPEVGHELSDALLEARVSTALMREIGANALGIDVETADGVVTLRGEVDTTTIRATAISTAEDVEGVDRVIDLVKVG